MTRFLCSLLHLLPFLLLSRAAANNQTEPESLPSPEPWSDQPLCPLWGPMEGFYSEGIEAGRVGLIKETMMIYDIFSVSGKVVATGQVRPAVRSDGKVPEPSVQRQLCQQDNPSTHGLSHSTVRIQTDSCQSGAELIKLINYHPKLPFTEEISRGLRVDLSALRTSRTPTY